MISQFFRKAVSNSYEQQLNWPTHISTLQLVLNCSKSASRQFSPFFLTFFRRANFPFQEMFLPQPNYNESSTVAQRLNLAHETLKTAYDSFQQSFKKSKYQFDKLEKSRTFKEGSIVYVYTTQRSAKIHHKQPGEPAQPEDELQPATTESEEEHEDFASAEENDSSLDEESIGEQVDPEDSHSLDSQITVDEPETIQGPPPQPPTTGTTLPKPSMTTRTTTKQATTTSLTSFAERQRVKADKAAKKRRAEEDDKLRRLEEVEAKKAADLAKRTGAKPKEPNLGQRLAGKVKAVGRGRGKK